MSTMEAYPRLVETLGDLRRQWRFQKIVEGILLAFAGVAAVLVAVVAADNLLKLETGGRLVLALVLWGVLGVSLVALVLRRFLEDRRDDFFAALVEQKNPELRNLLINALQLGRGHHQGCSPGLIAAIVNDATRATADLDMAGSVDSRPARRAGLAALGVAAVLGGYAVLLGPWFGNGLTRVFLPAADIPAYTATRVESLKPGNTRVAEGTTVVVEAKIAGVVPNEVQLLRNGSADRWQGKDMDKMTADTYRFSARQVSESFDYYVAAGDGRSQKYHVEVVKRPQVKNLALTYAPPPYTGLLPRTIAKSDGAVAGIAGTTVTLELKATKPLQQASLVVGKDEEIPLAKSADDATWSGSFVIWSADAKMVPEITGRRVLAPSGYQIKMVDSEGYDNTDPLAHVVALARDQAPTVAITEPGQDRQVLPSVVVPLGVQARDDYGVGEVSILFRVNDESNVRELVKFSAGNKPELQTTHSFKWNLNTGGLKVGDRIHYWARALDRNNITGPGQAESRPFSLFLLTPELTVAKLEDLRIQDYAQLLEELLRLQRENRAQTASPSITLEPLVTRQTFIRKNTRQLARVMAKDVLPVNTIVKALDDLYAGLMATAVRLLEQGRDAGNPARALALRNDSLPVQDKIIAELQALLDRLQRNDQAREALKKLAKTDKAAHKKITETLSQLLKDLDKMLKDQTEVASKFEKLPTKPSEEYKDDRLKALKALDEFKDKANDWKRGKVNELTKLPTGFVDDFKMKPDVNRIYEEIEKAAQRSKAEKLDVSLEDLGAGLATKMKEDLEIWMPDSPDNLKWVLEEPLNKKRMKIPEMPLPKALEDMIGELLQKADEFDKEADDVTSAWGDNLDQAGWGVSDGPISSFSAKGKTGNDQPNNMELSGRSGDGRRGKSSGQMVGDTSRALPGRKTPARVGSEKYEPGQLKQEGLEDPNGATGGGKEAGSGRKGLQGANPPPDNFLRDMGRLNAKQAGLREKAEQIAKKLQTLGVSNKRLKESIKLMEASEKDLRDRRYDDGARKRRVAVGQLQSAFSGLDGTTATQLSQARDLPPQLRNELLQAADEGYPAGYEALLRNYFKRLAETEK